ncbi:chemotaxis protein CheB [Deinococcus hopiensis]|uniref:chemotaxis protein CheB n=1 Tax=Deinococcus hopiensis TaxID=309885 RepID=UPI002481A86A|nr:chemotaxis protein CheB [Deinococcus hopiensis]
MLSSVVDDGTSALRTIKHFGGTTAVQDAEYSSIPLSALNQMDVEHTVRARDLGALLVRLLGEPV